MDTRKTFPQRIELAAVLKRCCHSSVLQFCVCCGAVIHSEWNTFLRRKGAHQSYVTKGEFGEKGGLEWK